MSLLIKGMGMPKTCCQCDFKIYDNEMRWDENGIEQIGAWVCKKTREIIWNTQRGEKCPLAPLPDKHGRLIDADALIRDKSGEATLWCGYEYQDHSVVFEEDIKNAPTIVPAEGGGEDG